VRLLGIGGMGAVYQAWDAELGVTVAVKVVRPEVAADPATARDLERRFKRELLLARQVTHPNVVRIHDLGEIDGIKYITMPFVEGEDLATILKREGVLPAARALRIVRTMLGGMVAAHQAGVVHRDLKPANVMITADDQAMLMDFGIARSAGRPEPEPGAAPRAPGPQTGAGGATILGSVVGTIEYMAPEQARGEAVDQRADIYAFGLICYDMLVGRQRHERAASAFNELLARMDAAPPTPRSVNPEVPEPLDRIVQRCLQPDPAARYQTTVELAAAVDRLDENGKLLPLVRRLTPRLVATVALAVAALVGGTYYFAQRPVQQAIQHEPVSVLIADFDNRANDSSLTGTLEPVLKLALEGAGFVSAYDRTAVSRSLGVRPPDKLDERAALELAVRQGVHVVLSGSVSREGNRYTVSVKATQAVTGKVITANSDRTSDKAEVLKIAAHLVEPVREALGDTTTSDEAQRFALEALSATSLEAVHDYARGLQALSASDFEKALQDFSSAVKRDPKFGGAYGAMAIASFNLDRRQDAVKYLKSALEHLDSMTERERYRTRGFYYLVTDDYQACVKEYGDLIGKYSADASARNNRALCFSYLRNVPAALAETRQVVKILPNRKLYQQNLAQYLAYAGEFSGAEQQVLSIKQPGMFGLLAQAFAQIGQGRVADAEGTYRALSGLDEQGASYTASGLADVATYEGRFGDAVRLLEAGAAADLASKDTDRAADKFVALARVERLRGRKAQAVAAAEKALANSQAVKIRFLAARVFLEAGASARAIELSQGLASGLQASSRAHAKIITGLAALQQRDTARAVEELSAANGLLDTWIGQYDLGRAYLEAGALLQADSSFERCLKRRGEALSLFLDDEPSYSYLPPVYYYQGRVREGLNSAKAAESYQAYLGIRAKSNEDPLVPEVRRRAVR
jgi:serine/threonine-protein kinase